MGNDLVGMETPKIERWEKKLKNIFDEIDDYLEDTYGTEYELHPARADRGTTSSKGQDGLFNIGAKFSAGFGSHFGKGYVVDIEMVTLEHVPRKIRENIEKDVLEKLKSKVTLHFPDRQIRIDFDTNVIKIHGDLYS